MKNEETYKLLTDIHTCESGPSLEAGELVTILAKGAFGVLAVSVDAHEDVGNGIDEPTMEHTTAWVAYEDMELVSE